MIMKKLSILTIVLAVASFSFAQSTSTEVKKEQEVKVETVETQETNLVKPSVEVKKATNKKTFNTDAIEHKEAVKKQSEKAQLQVPADKAGTLEEKKKATGTEVQ